MLHTPITFASPAGLSIASAIALATIGVALWRRILIPRSSFLLITLALICFALAAGRAQWELRDLGRVAVCVDTSPSTRTATFRDKKQLARRIKQLLGATHWRLFAFSSQTTETTIERLRETPTTRTSYTPPTGFAAAVLFTDAQFDPPPPEQSPPTYVVVDPALDRPDDAQVERLEARDGGVAVTMNVPGPTTRQLLLGGEDPRVVERIAVPPGRSVVTHATTLPYVSVRLSPFDRWSENDGLSLFLPPPPKFQRWWISTGNDAPPGWRRFAPGDLPAEMVSPYLAAGVIVLDNVPADAFSRYQRGRLEQYVRELGGGLVILGGEHAFAAGGYTGTPLESLSPLASTPPLPSTHWIVLTDSSGSMSARIGDNSRWSFAAYAIRQMLPLLPADDPVTLGDFAQATRWWCRDKTAGQLDFNRLVPRELMPHGPTNLEPALRDIADTADGSLPTIVFLITDAQTTLPKPDALANALANKRVRVHLLVHDPLPSQHALRTIVERTGGTILPQADPRQWASALQQLLRQAEVPRLEHTPVSIRFTNAGPALGALATDRWNRTWLKKEATALATTADATTAPATTGAATPTAMIAAWNLGAGAVISVAFSPPMDVAQTLADRVMTPPRDPRFRVTWEIASPLRVRIDAIDNGRFLNDLQPRLELASETARPQQGIPIPQIAPGRYELSFEPPRRSTLATAYLDNRVLDRIPAPSRYDPEFDHIGNNLANMRQIAEPTGGRIIEPTDVTPIGFRFPPRTVGLGSWLAVAGAILVATSLVRWRMR